MAREDDDGKKPLERLAEKLYSKQEPGQGVARTPLHQQSGMAQSEWRREPSAVPLRARTKMTFATKLLFAATVFFVIAAGISLFVFLGGTNIISTRNVNIVIAGPVAIPAGEELAYGILIENKNSAALEFTDLLIEYPEGTRSAGDIEQELKRTRMSLGLIEPRSIVRETARAVLFGQEGDEKTILISLEYRIADSNAIFVVEKEYKVLISASPLRVSVLTLNEISAGQEFGITLQIASNSQSVVEGVLVSIDYPFGFSFVAAIPEPTYGETTWRIGDIAPGTERIIEIRGILEGQDGEEKIFRISSGVPNRSSPETIGVAYSTVRIGTTIVRPFLSLELLVNGAVREEYAIASEEQAIALIRWTNNTPVKITDALIEVKLTGNALAKRSVIPRDGFYRSAEDTIIWDKGTLPDLASVEPGEGGSTSFRFFSLPLVSAAGALIEEPTIKIAISAGGRRVSERGVAERVENTILRLVKISSDVELRQRALYFTGPISNVGPMPPKVEQETTYTIVWSLVNSSNSVRNAVVEAVLPPYVRWVGLTVPRGESIFFDESSAVVRWDAGRVLKGTGISSPVLEVAYQVTLIPSTTQVNALLDLVGEVVFSGVDEFTDTPLRTTARAVNTRLTTDPRFKLGDGRVVE